MTAILSSLLFLTIGFFVGYFWSKGIVTITISEMKSNGSEPIVQTKGNVEVKIKSNQVKTS